MKLVNSSIRFNKVILRLIFSHSFLVITFFGNLIIVSFSFIFYWLEYSVNKDLVSLLDAIWWGFTTATTVGYGDIIPVTAMGKVVGIFLMLIGTALFATYTALFAQTILEDELFRFKINADDHEDDILEQLKSHRKLLDKQIRHYKRDEKRKSTQY